ncbi:MAG: ABC transporter ATP-binding protein [delta proteobacterium MLS_D]|nr:MAG: ABC transporter ATP-binding protein [delta proteobacterium MLS_D]
MLNLDKVNISYGIIQVIYDVTLHLDEGECVALLGSNGTGKTTILNALSGESKIMSGTITFCGERIENLSASERYEMGIIQVPEGGKIFPHMTVKENLMMGASCRQKAWDSRKETLERVYSIFPKLKERFNQEAKLLSGGERQIMVIGRGLMACPRLLMIDEPSLGLAPKILLEIYSTMKLLKDEMVTILLAEQNVSQALNLCSRGYVLETGRVVMEDSSESLLSNDYIKTAYLGL